MALFMNPKPQGPWSEYSKTTWMGIKAYKIESQSMTGSRLVTESNSVAEFRFIVPDFIETISHEWAPYETIASKINQKTSSIAQEIKVFVDWTKGGSINLVTYKADTPLKYEGSGRREWTFEIDLVSMGHKEGKNRSMYDVMPIVNALKELSTGFLGGELGSSDGWLGQAAQYGLRLQKLLPPYVFDIRIPRGATDKDDAVLYIASPNNYAVLTSVQPTFKAPYRDGLPTVCNMQLTFKELSPFYRSNVVPDIVSKGDTAYRDNWNLGGQTKSTSSTTVVGGVDIGTPF